MIYEHESSPAGGYPVGLLIISVMASSVKTKRHTLWQLMGGGLIAAVCLFLTMFLFCP